MSDKDKSKVKLDSPRGVKKEILFKLPDLEVLSELVGEHDKNLRFLEKRLDLKIGRSEGGLILAGQDSEVDLAYDLLGQLSEVIQGGDSVYEGDLERAVKLLSSDRRARLGDLFRESIAVNGRRKNIVPKTQNQLGYINAIKQNDIVFGIGPAGTGKTYLAMAMAVASLLHKEVKRVVLCRPAVEAGEKLGFLPGDMAEKVNPYLRPLYDALHEMVDYDRAKEMIEKGIVEVAPLAFMRGRTLSNAFVILDEAQNTTPMQMKMLLTRIGLGSRCVVTGDLTQVDLPPGITSGLRDVLSLVNEVESVDVVNFNETDVIRHPVVARIVAAYDKRDRKNAANKN